MVATILNAGGADRLWGSGYTTQDPCLDGENLGTKLCWAAVDGTSGPASLEARLYQDIDKVLRTSLQYRWLRPRTGRS